MLCLWKAKLRIIERNWLLSISSQIWQNNLELYFPIELGWNSVLKKAIELKCRQVSAVMLYFVSLLGWESWAQLWHRRQYWTWKANSALNHNSDTCRALVTALPELVHLLHQTSNIVGSELSSLKGKNSFYLIFMLFLTSLNSSLRETKNNVADNNQPQHQLCFSFILDYKVCGK